LAEIIEVILVYFLGVPFGRAFHCNLLLVPHKSISIAIPNASIQDPQSVFHKP